MQLQLVDPQHEACARTDSWCPGCAEHGSTDRISGFRYESVTEPLVQHGPVGMGLLDTRGEGFGEELCDGLGADEALGDGEGVGLANSAGEGDEVACDLTS